MGLADPRRHPEQATLATDTPLIPHHHAQRAGGLGTQPPQAPQSRATKPRAHAIYMNNVRLKSKSWEVWGQATRAKLPTGHQASKHIANHLRVHGKFYLRLDPKQAFSV